jgi:hypothetical protein
VAATEHAELPREDSRREHDAAGRLSPWAGLATGAPGWQITTRTRRLAVAVATDCAGTVHRHEKGQWQARITRPALTVVVTDADTRMLWCRLGVTPDSGIFAVPFAQWQAATVLEHPLTEFPLPGQLSVRDFRLTTRMHRTVRYLIPVFTPG